MRKSIGVSAKLILSVVLILFISILVTTLFMDSKLKSITNDLLLKLGQVKMDFAIANINNKVPGDWEIKDGYIYKGETLINDNMQIVDLIANEIHGNVTVFLGDTRVATNVLNADGKTRAIGTKAANEVTQTTLIKGEAYDKQLKINGKMYMASYTAIKDSKGQIIGMLFTGTPIDDLLNNIRAAIAVVYLVSGILILLGCIAIFFIVKKINKPIQGALSIADKISNGDLTARVQVKVQDEIGQLVERLNSTAASLELMIKNIINSAENVSRASSEISAGNQDLSQRIQEEASSLEETSTAIEELTATVKSNTHNAQKANSMAASTTGIVKEGNKVVNETIDAMNALMQSSKKITDIINVVNEIAFQTNLLALNAAVEAARAGEQGKGFAVVASEVRNLSQRSAESAKQIQNLINDSIDKIQNGNELVLKTGSTLDKITESVQEMAIIVEEISNASFEQSKGIEEINKAIVQIGQITQKNAYLVEESAASSEMMSGEAEELYNLTAQFKV